jgi:hypothetical protein
MGQSGILEIEKSILSLPIREQRKLIARVSETLRKRAESEHDDMLQEMANDPFIQLEIKSIEQDFATTEFDGLAK